MTSEPSTNSRPERPRRAQTGGSTASLLVVATVVVLGAAGWWWAGGDAPAGAVDPDRVVNVERRELFDAVNASGRVEPLARVAVMSRASGILDAILVEEGDQVTRGQVLAELDREQLEAQLAQDTADLASAQARVAASRSRLAEARVRVDDPELAFARQRAQRYEELFASGDVSQNERDDTALALEQVQFRITQMQANIPVLEAAVAEAQANLAAAEAALDRSQTALREATIRCPIDGIVLVRDKEVGDGVSSILTAGGNATQILTLGDLSEMFIEARVDEVDLGRISVGMPARVTVDAHRGKVLLGEVARIAPSGSVDNNGIVTFEVRVTLADPEGLLRPDMTADAKLVLDTRPDALSLPQRALARGPGGRWQVRKVSGEGAAARAEVIEVEIGLSDGLMTEIVSGLEEGDRVLLPEVTSFAGRR